MTNNAAVLVKEFIELSLKMTQEYVSISGWLRSYTALDLLSDGEFQPILKKLAYHDIDLFLVLSACMGLYLRMPAVEFKTTMVTLDREEKRIVLDQTSSSSDLEQYQKAADRAINRYLESTLLNVAPRPKSSNQYLN